MDLVHNRASMLAEEDRISNLPDDVIHHIFSFLDMKYAVQSCTFSKKWKIIWISMPHLNFNSDTFRTMPLFDKFVKKTLCHRNNLTEVSAAKLAFTGAATDSVVNRIVEYAYSHNVKQMTMFFSTPGRHEFPRYIFSSQTLKHLTFSVYHSIRTCCILQFPWDFPALETLNIKYFQFCGDGETKTLDLFSKCVKLKDLTLHTCSMFKVETFDVCATQLSNLTVTNASLFPTVLNVVAPQLQNLTISFSAAYADTLRLSTEGFNSLEKVNLSLLISRLKYDLKICATVLLDLFQKLRNTKYLILNIAIIEALSSYLDQVSHEPSPFHNLKCLKIDTESLKPKDSNIIATMATKVGKYLLQNSPTATFIMNLPQVVQKKKSMLEVEKEAKLEAEKQQPDTMAEEKRMLEAKLQMKDEVIEKLISQMLNCKMAELKIHVKSGNPNYELIRSMGCEIKSIMDLIPDEGLKVTMEAQFSSQYEEVKNMFLSCIHGIEWAKIETQLLGNIITHSQRTRSSANCHMATSSSVPFIMKQQGRSTFTELPLLVKAMISCIWISLFCKYFGDVFGLK